MASVDHAFTSKELLARADAPATRARLLLAVPETGDVSTVDLVEVLVLRARAAAERLAAGAGA